MRLLSFPGRSQTSFSARMPFKVVRPCLFLFCLDTLTLRHCEGRINRGPAVYETSATCSTPFQCVQPVQTSRDFSRLCVSDRSVLFRFVHLVCWRFCWQAHFPRCSIDASYPFIMSNPHSCSC